MLELFEGSTIQDHLRFVFNDKEAGCRDYFTKERSWDIFHSSYGNIDKAIPVCNPLTLNLGKLVVPNFFVEPMLIRELAKAYDVPILMVRTTKGYVLLDISLGAIIQCFDLDNSTLTIINKDNLKRDYENKKDTYKKDLVPHFMRKLYKYSQNYVPPSEREPFKLDYFEPYFVKTYYALGKVLGVDCGLTKLPIDFMMMAINIKHSSINELYDFASAIHEGLVRAENKDEKLEFLHYSLVCHLILYEKQSILGPRVENKDK